MTRNLTFVHDPRPNQYAENDGPRASSVIYPFMRSEYYALLQYLLVRLLPEILGYQSNNLLMQSKRML